MKANKKVTTRKKKQEVPAKKSLCTDCKVEPVVLPILFCENCHKRQTDEDHFHPFTPFHFKDEKYF